MRGARDTNAGQSGCSSTPGMKRASPPGGALGVFGFRRRRKTLAALEFFPIDSGKLPGDVIPDAFYRDLSGTAVEERDQLAGMQQFVTAGIAAIQQAPRRRRFNGERFNRLKGKSRRRHWGTP